MTAPNPPAPTELHACPFCGCDAEVRATHDEFFRKRSVVVCRGCDATSEPSIGVDRAITAWNRRAPVDDNASQAAEIAGLREAISRADRELQMIESIRSAVIQDFDLLERAWPPSKRGSRAQNAYDDMKARWEGVAACVRDARTATDTGSRAGG